MNNPMSMPSRSHRSKPRIRLSSTGRNPDQLRVSKCIRLPDVESNDRTGLNRRKIPDSLQGHSLRRYLLRTQVPAEEEHMTKRIAR